MRREERRQLGTLIGGPSPKLFHSQSTLLQGDLHVGNLLKDPLEESLVESLEEFLEESLEEYLEESLEESFKKRKTEESWKRKGDPGAFSKVTGLPEHSSLTRILLGKEKEIFGGNSSQALLSIFDSSREQRLIYGSQEDAGRLNKQRTNSHEEIQRAI
ncbi:unnamed protein product [Allacma fusca]|uniref:Uncharacterized protein n=1 Tax=Allacma fusca TaxID=39272 RepID=A0A8J2L422_9HEXA|nr:unnamed protein product [Allacma fusca]